MSVKTRIAEKHPRTGALPAEQIAEKAAGEEQQGGLLGMTESDKLIYQLVENNVAYAGEQFGENLRFNSETLTNVLYDNIYKLLGEKFEEDEFINWLVDELVESGAITKEQPEETETKEEQEPEQPKEEAVYELDDSEYRELQAKVGAAIELVKANKLTIFKILSDVDNHIKSLSDTGISEFGEYDSELYRLRDQEIQSLVKKIQGNWETFDEHLQTRDETKDELAEKLEEIQEAVEETKKERENAIVANNKVSEGIKNTLEKIGSNFGQKMDDVGKWEKMSPIMEKSIKSIESSLSKLQGQENEKKIEVAKPLKAEKQKPALEPVQNKIVKPTKEEKGQKSEKKNPTGKAKIVQKPSVKKQILKKEKGEGDEEPQTYTKTRTIVVTVVPRNVKKPKKEDVLKKAFDKTKGQKKIVKSPVAETKRLVKDGGTKEQRKTSVLPRKVQKLQATRSPAKKPSVFKRSAMKVKTATASLKKQVQAKVARMKRETVLGKMNEFAKQPFEQIAPPLKMMRKKVSTPFESVGESSAMEVLQGKITKFKENVKEFTKGVAEKTEVAKQQLDRSFLKPISRTLTKTIPTKMAEVGGKIRTFATKTAPIKESVVGKMSGIVMRPTATKKLKVQKAAPKTMQLPQRKLGAKLTKPKGKTTKQLPKKYAKAFTAPTKRVLNQRKSIPASVKKLSMQKPISTKPTGSQIKVSNKGGMCICPICGNRHYPGQHSHVSLEKESASRVVTRSVPSSFKPAPTFKQGAAKAEMQNEAKQQAGTRLQQMPFAPARENKPRGMDFVAGQQQQHFPPAVFKGADKQQPQPFPVPMEPFSQMSDKEFRDALFGKNADKFTKSKQEREYEEGEVPKPTLKERIQGRIRSIKGNAVSNLKNSRLGKSWSNVKTGLKKTKQMAKKIWSKTRKVAKFVGKVIAAPVKLAWKTTKFAYKAAKGTAKAFVKASKFAGNALWAGAKGLVKLGKGAVKGLSEDLQDIFKLPSAKDAAAGGKGGGKAAAASQAAKAQERGKQIHEAG